MKPEEVDVNIYIMCPGRHISDDVSDKINAHVQSLEKKGHHVHVPRREVDLADHDGLDICLRNAEALREAHEVHVWHFPPSNWGIFDLGALVMASMIIGPRKRVVVINRNEFERTEGMSFTNILLAM